MYVDRHLHLDDPWLPDPEKRQRAIEDITAHNRIDLCAIVRPVIAREDPGVRQAVGPRDPILWNPALVCERVHGPARRGGRALRVSRHAWGDRTRPRLLPEYGHQGRAAGSSRCLPEGGEAKRHGAEPPLPRDPESLPSTTFRGVLEDVAGIKGTSPDEIGALNQRNVRELVGDSPRVAQITELLESNQGAGGSTRPAL